MDDEQPTRYVARSFPIRAMSDADANELKRLAKATGEQAVLARSILQLSDGLSALAVAMQEIVARVAPPQT